MKLVKEKRKADPTIPVVAMSDIAFLLIIFFLVTTNFMKESHIRLKLPKAEAAEKEEKVKNSVSVDENGVIWLNGAETESLKLDLANLLGAKKGEHRKVFLKCHKELTYSEYMPVIQEINEAGGILVLKTDEKGPSGKKEKDDPKEQEKDEAPAPPPVETKPKAEPEPGPAPESGLELEP